MRIIEKCRFMSKKIKQETKKFVPSVSSLIDDHVLDIFSVRNKNIFLSITFLEQSNYEGLSHETFPK